MISAGMRRGLYPHWFAAVASLWAGGLAISVAHQSPVGWWLIIGGLIGYAWWRRRTGAWVQEIQNPRERWLLIPGTLLFGLIMLGGKVARQEFGVILAPFFSGAIVAGGLFLLMEISTRSIRTRLQHDEVA
jgi:hypothetical protein